MSLRLSKRDDVASAEDSLRRIAAAVGGCVGRDLVLHCRRFIGESSGLEIWRAFISDSDEFVSAKQFSWIPSAPSRDSAIRRLLNRCFAFFGVRSVEECEIKLAVLGRSAVERSLGLERRQP